MDAVAEVTEPRGGAAYVMKEVAKMPQKSVPELPHSGPDGCAMDGDVHGTPVLLDLRLVL